MIAPGSTSFKLCPIASPEHRLMKRCRLHLLNFLACFAMLVGVNAVVAAENLRYLFLVDHSPAMATRRLPTVDTINYLVRSGFENQIQPGEKFAIWFYGSRLQTNAPLTWQPGRGTEFGRFTANLFSGRIYGRIPPREQTLADAAPFIAASPKITIFIFTDGSQPLSGTPYDTAINKEIEKHRLEFQVGEKPFIITLTANNGAWTGGHVHTDVNRRFENPELRFSNDLSNKALGGAAPGVKTNSPVEMDKALAALRSAPAPTQNPTGEIDKARDVLRDALAGAGKPADTNAPIPVRALQFAPALKEAPPEQVKLEQPKIENPQPQVAVVSPLIATPKPQEQKTELPPQKIEPAPAKPIEVAAVPTPAPAPPVKTAEEPPVAREEPKAVVKEEPKPVVRELPKVVAKAPTPVQSKQVSPQPTPNTATQSEKTELKKTAPTTNAAAAATQPKPPALNSLPPPQTAALTPPQKPFPLPILVAGLFLIATVGAMALRNARRRAKSPGSIITQALPPSDGPPFRK